MSYNITTCQGEPQPSTDGSACRPSRLRNAWEAKYMSSIVALDLAAWQEAIPKEVAPDVISTGTHVANVTCCSHSSTRFFPVLVCALGRSRPPASPAVGMAPTAAATNERLREEVCPARCESKAASVCTHPLSHAHAHVLPCRVHSSTICGPISRRPAALPPRPRVCRRPLRTPPL